MWIVKIIFIIKAERMLQKVQDDITKDIQRMVGVGANEHVFSDISYSLKKRLPWLHINLATAFLAAAFRPPISLDGYRHEPPPGSLLRKKLVRRFMGRASCLRICSMRLRSLSFFRAFSSLLLSFLFFSSNVLSRISMTFL